MRNLNMYLEALACYDEAIKLHPNNFIYFCCRANLLNDMGQEEESFEDFNKAYEVKKSSFGKLGYDDWDFNDETQLKLIKVLRKFQERVFEFKTELQNIKEITKDNSEINKEIEEKEKEYIEQHTSFLRRAIFWLTERDDDSYQEMKLVINEINERLVTEKGEVAQLLAYGCMQSKEDITK